MPTSAVEPLERRDHFAATPKLDPNYTADADALRAIAGQDISIYQAVPGPGDRTYVLAQRHAAGDLKVSPGFYASGLVTIAAYGADGKLDASFGTRGVALTGLRTQDHYDFVSPGVLKTDDIGRVYFADDTHVLRLHADGTADRAIGTGGIATFAGANQPVALCDITPDGGGVLVATTRVRRGVQQFAVQRVGRRVKTVWTAAHATGVTDLTTDGTANASDTGDRSTYQYLANDQAQFARRRGGLVLVRLDTDEEIYTTGSADTGSYETDGATDQRLVVTRFDAAGRGKDAMTADLGRAPDHYAVNLREIDEDFGVQDVANHGPLLSPSGRVLTVQTDKEIIRLKLHGRSFTRLNSEGDVFGKLGYLNLRDAQLLSDGNVYALTQFYDPPGSVNFWVQKYAIDEDFAGAKAVGGALAIPNAAFSSPRDDTELAQLFLGASGRLYFYAGGTSRAGATVALRRV